MSRQEIEPSCWFASLPGGCAPSSPGAVGSSAPGGVGSLPGGAGSDPGGAASDPGGVASEPGGVASDPGGVASDPGGGGSWAVTDCTWPNSTRDADRAIRIARIPILRMLTSWPVEVPNSRLITCI